MNRLRREEREAAKIGMTREEIRILATYNGEVSRGIIHTDEWKGHMQRLQSRFSEGQKRKMMDEGYVEVGPGLYMRGGQEQ